MSYLNGPVPERAISANLRFKFQAMIAVTFLFTSLETRRELGRVNFLLRLLGMCLGREKKCGR